MTMIEKVKTASLNEMEEVLNEYVREGYDVDKLLDNFNEFDFEKKVIIVKRFWNTNYHKFEEVVTYAKDIEFMIKYLMERRLTAYAYDYLVKIISKEMIGVEINYLNEIIDYVSTDAMVNDTGSYFLNEILNKKTDYYKLLSIKDKLSDDEIDLIYNKSFERENDFIHIFDYLRCDEKKEYTRKFVSINSDNYMLAKALLYSGYYDEESYEKLLLLIGAFASADVIYDVLIDHQVNKSQKQMLEKALYDTKDIEYIAYYTFYRNKKEFNRLFGSGLMFLAFVSLNKQLFTNERMLLSVTDAIKEKEVKYTDSIVNKIDTSYQIKPKNGVKPNK